MPWALDTEIREPLCELTSRRDKAVLNAMVYSNLEKIMFYNVLPIFLQQHYNSIYTSLFQSLSFVIFPVVIPSCMVVFTFHFSTFCKLHKTLNASFLLLF